MRAIDTHTKLAALWLFILLNIIFRDIHQLGMKWYLEMLLTGMSSDGTPITEELMLIVAIIIEIPVSMVLFSLLLARQILRPMTFVAAGITTAGLVSMRPTDMDDVFFLVVGLAAMLAILWTVWIWPESDQASSALPSDRQ